MLRYLRLPSAFLLFLLSTSSWAIVDIERLRTANPDERGMVGETLLQSTGQAGNTQNTIVSFQNNLAWLQDISDWMFIARYRYGESLNVPNANEGFLHLRYSRDIQAVAHRWESYVQGDFNEFRNLIERSLVGSNLRWHLIQNERSNVSFAAGAFVYRERLSVEEVGEQQDEGGRMNFHLVYSTTLLKEATFAIGAYIQPKIGEWEDVHALGSLSVESPLAGNFMMTLAMDYRYDSVPPGDIKNYDLGYTTGIKYSY